MYQHGEFVSPKQNINVSSSTVRSHRDIPAWEIYVRNCDDINDHFVFARDEGIPLLDDIGDGPITAHQR